MSESESDHGGRTKRIPKRVIDVTIDGEAAVMDEILEQAVSRSRAWLDTRPPELRPKTEEALRNSLSTFCQVSVRYDVDEWIKALLDRKFVSSTSKKFVVREALPVGRGRGSRGRGAARGRAAPRPPPEIKSIPAVSIAADQWGTVPVPASNDVFGNPEAIARRVMWHLQSLPRQIPLRQFRSGLAQTLRVKAIVPVNFVVACVNGEPSPVGPWMTGAPVPKGATVRALQSLATNRNKHSTGSRRVPVVQGGSVEESTASHGASGSLLFRKHGAPASSIAAFDMDDTLITTKLGQVFSEGRGDWKWLHPTVPAKLKDLVQRGFRIVIFTNQGGINTKGTADDAKAKEIMGKIDDISVELDLPLTAVVATKDDSARKPSRFMWDWFCENLNKGVEVDLSQSFFVGDAAGRKVKTLAGRDKDFSCTDRKFAHNVGVRFLTPEEFLVGAAPAPFQWDGLSPDDLQRALSSGGSTSQGWSPYPSSELVVMVGMPGSGKSTVSNALAEAGYVRVNRDTLKTMDACYAAASNALGLGKSVVIDNTNGSVEERQRWIELAKKHFVPSRAFLLTTPLEMAQHLALMRERLGKASHIPTMVYNMFKSKYQEPSTSEGFTTVVQIPFVANFPEGSEERRLFLQLS